MRKFLAFIFVASVFGLSAQAQSVTNLYSAGVSYNQSATPAVAGTALYAHLVSADSAPGMYAFTVLDVLPNGTKPFTVSTNVGVGIAQRIATIAGHDVLIPTSAGISFTGTNTGWAWSTGAAVPFKLKTKSVDGGGWYIVPTVRVVKSSVSNGTGYQPVFGILAGWGK